MIRKILFKLAQKSRGMICYVNGPETLPRPLSQKEEAQALMNIDDPAQREKLVEHNLRLVVFIAKKFENTGVGIEDLVSIGTIGLIKGVNTFRPDKNIKLATYASRCIENEILMYLRKCSGRTEISIDEPLNVDWDGNELLLSDVLFEDQDSVSSLLENDEDRKTVRLAILDLSPREQEIICLRFGLKDGKEYTQKDVANMLGISQSYISRLEKRILDRLRDKLLV